MARTRALCCLIPSKPSGNARRRSSAACICCIGPHHRPSGGGALAPIDADNSSVRTPLTSCCGTGDAAVRTPRTPKTPSARRLCGVRSRTPRRAQQVRRFPPAPAAPAAALARAAAAPAPARTPVAAAASAGPAQSAPTAKAPLAAAAPPARTPVASPAPAGPALAAPAAKKTPVAAAASAGAAALALPPARTPRTPSTPIGRTQRVCCVTSAAPAKPKTGSARRRWLSSASKAVAQVPRNEARAVAGAVRDSSANPRGNGEVAKTVYSAALLPHAVEAAPAKEDESVCSNDEEYALLCREGFSREDVAAVTIQAYFRAHLARRAFKALKSLVRLQAVARGAYVRRQAEVAVNCMQAMARLQARVRARQSLAKPKPNGGGDDDDGKLLLPQS